MVPHLHQRTRCGRLLGCRTDRRREHSLPHFAFPATPALSSNAPETRQRRVAADILPKLAHACGAPLAMTYDGESLRKHNKDIGYDQTDGANECEEPLRYLWAACQTAAGKAAVKASGLAKVVCKGVAGATGALYTASASVGASKLGVTNGFSCNVLTENNHFISQNAPIDLGKQAGTGSVQQAVGNLFESCTGNQKGSGTAFTPPYDYKSFMVPAADVKALVQKRAGATLQSPTACP